jgi:hypothetical protein
MGHFGRGIPIGTYRIAPATNSKRMSSVNMQGKLDIQHIRYTSFTILLTPARWQIGMAGLGSKGLILPMVIRSGPMPLLSLRRLSVIRDSLFSLSDLLCPARNEMEIPSPIDVRNCLVRSSRLSFRYPADILAAMAIVPPPEVANSIPDDIQAMIDRSVPDLEAKPLQGWRVVFISERSTE